MLLPTQTCVAVSFISSVWTKPLMSCTLLPVSAAGWFVSAVFLQPHTDSQVINLKQNREDFYVFRGVNLFRVQRAVCFHKGFMVSTVCFLWCTFCLKNLGLSSSSPSSVLSTHFYWSTVTKNELEVIDVSDVSTIIFRHQSYSNWHLMPVYRHL